jgi:prophage regulatory protein
MNWRVQTSSAEPRTIQSGNRPPRFLRYDELKSYVPFTRQHLGRLEKANLFPKRIQIGANTVAWREDEVARWAEERSSRRAKVA